MSSSAPSQGGLNSEAMREKIRTEINDLKATARSFKIDAIKDGSWFNEFLASCLKGYHERVMKQGGEAYLRNKYSGLPTDAVAGKLCQLAEQAAGLAGSLSGAAASGAVFTAGAGITAAGLAVMGEVLYTIRLQLRLVYDLHLLYGIPLDTSDPEDLMAIFAVVDDIKLAEVGGIGAKALGPEVMRAQLFRLIHGNTKAIQSVVRQVLGTRIARSVTQRSIIKTVVPVAGIAISAGWNYTATRLMGSRVRQEMRIKAGLREEAAYLHGKLSSDEQISLAVIEGMMALAIADGEFDDLEREVYLSFLNQLGLDEEQLSKLASKIHTDLEGVLKQLARVEDENSRVAIGRCFCLLAASDGVVRPAEKDLLRQLLEVIDQSKQLEQADELCARFRKEKGALGQAMDKTANVVGWVKGKLPGGKKQAPPAARQEKEFKADAKEQQAQVLLQKLAQLDEQLAAGEISIKTYQERWGQLKAKIAGIATADPAVPASH